MSIIVKFLPFSTINPKKPGDQGNQRDSSGGRPDETEDETGGTVLAVRT